MIGQLKKYSFITLTVALFSCASPMSKKYHEDTVKDDLIAIKSELDSTDQNLLVASMIRLKIQGATLEELTYDEMLEIGKKWKAEREMAEAEQKALAEKAAAEEAARFERLNQAVVVSCYEKGYKKVDYEDYITYKFVIRNKSDKNIRALKGSLAFNNLFDEVIQTINFVYDQPIAVGQEVVWSAQSEYNQFIDKDKALRNKDLKDMKVVWKPEKIIFQDGTTME